jgi:hypothetical protein
LKTNLRPDQKINPKQTQKHQQKTQLSHQTQKSQLTPHQKSHKKFKPNQPFSQATVFGEKSF